MKKSLVLAMAMALGVTASAYAANPFSDVPAGHWAYDSINKLAAAGIVDGYGDSTFGGDRLMTRYEMAQIVAKAMAKGANVDRLAAEFADELDSLGVRVAALEKKSDNVKITGQIRASYQDIDFKNASNSTASKLRTRLFISGQINDDWKYTGRLQNEQVFAHSNAGEDNDTKLNWAYVSGKIGGTKVDAGRQDFKIHTGTVVDTTFDGAKFVYGENVKVSGYVGKAASFVTGASDDRFYAVDVAGKLGVVDAYATYYNVDNALDQEIYVVGAGMKVAKDLKLSAEYLHGKFDEMQRVGFDKNGYMVGLAYAGAKAAKVGSYGVYVNYYDQPAATYLNQTTNGYNGVVNISKFFDGFKGFEVGANYTLAKNIVAGVKYYDLDTREGDEGAKTLWSEVVFTF